ncbi:MAG: hypothetical protein P8Y67_14260, partial [Alphaproteobacteria bacterium]
LDVSAISRSARFTDITCGSIRIMSQSLIFRFLIIGVLSLAFFVTWSASAQTVAAEPDVRSVVKKFFKAYLNRSLTDKELNKVVADYRLSYDDADHCKDECRIATKIIEVKTRHLTSNPSTPKELLLRPNFLGDAFFDPQSEGSLFSNF